MASEATGVTGLAGRYATALYETADAEHALDAVASDLATLNSMIRESADLALLLRSPLVDRTRQAAAVEKLAVQAQLSLITQKFLGVVGRHRRLFALPQIIGAFQAILASRRGEVKAVVTAAQALSDAQIASVTDQLKRVVGARVSIDFWVDPSLIAGMVIKVGSRMVDGSLSTKLQRLQYAMRGN